MESARKFIPIELVGDHRIRDDDAFLVQFTLPGESTKVRTLEEANPLPSDERIRFEEEGHKYFVDGTRVLRSVTSIVKEYHDEFIAEQCVDTMINGRNWQTKRTQYMNPDGSVMTREQIMAKWAKSGRIASARGTLMHFHIEMLLNGAILEEPLSAEITQFKEYEQEIILAQGYAPFRTELCVFHKELQVAGQADAVFRHVDGTYAIFDWKRSKEIKRRHPIGRTMGAPLDCFPDTNYYHYCLQLNIYKYILESEYGLRIRALHLGVFHPDRCTYEDIPLPVWGEKVLEVVRDQVTRVLPRLVQAEEEKEDSDKENVKSSPNSST